MDNRLLLLLVPVATLLGAGIAFAVIGGLGGSGTWETLRVDTSGMTPGYAGGLVDLSVQVDAFASARDASPGEVVVYESAALDRYCLSRVVGVPGANIDINGKTVKVDGHALIHTYVSGSELSQVYEERHAGRAYTVVLSSEGLPGSRHEVGDTTLYLLPDNRTNARESCFGGPVAFRRVQGRVE